MKKIYFWLQELPHPLTSYVLSVCLTEFLFRIKVFLLSSVLCDGTIYNYLPECFEVVPFKDLMSCTETVVVYIIDVRSFFSRQMRQNNN